jgi:hypothetical protein
MRNLPARGAQRQVRAAAKRVASLALARIRIGASAISWPAASQARQSSRLPLDAGDLAAIVRADRRGVPRQVGAAQRGRVDPAAARKPPAAVGDRPAGELAGFFALDVAQLIGAGCCSSTTRCWVAACRSSRARCRTPVWRQRSGKPASISAAQCAQA